MITRPSTADFGESDDCAHQNSGPASAGEVSTLAEKPPLPSAAIATVFVTRTPYMRCAATPRPASPSNRFVLERDIDEQRCAADDALVIAHRCSTP